MQELEGLAGDKEVESVMITATPPSKDVRSRKRDWAVLQRMRSRKRT